MQGMAQQETIGFMDFCNRFATEEACREYLFELRWPEGFMCPKCGGKEYYDIRARKKYQCKSCRHQTTPTVGTVMDKTHLPIKTWFWAIYLVSSDKRGFSATLLSKKLKLPYKTAWFLLHRIRAAMKQRDEKYLLAGIVEYDDTYFGKPGKGGKRGRGTSKSKVVVAVSKSKDGKPKFVKMQVVPNLKGKTIGAFAKQAISEGATIQTDAYSSYRKPLQEKYLYEYEVFDADSEMLHWLHILIGNAKAFVQGTFHGLGRKHLQRYLDEFCYRFNRRAFGDEVFARLLNATVNAHPLRFSALTE